MIARLNFFLLLSALILAALVFYPQKQYVPITSLSADQLERIWIKDQGELIRKNGGWWIGQRRIADQKWLQKLLHIPELPSLESFPAAEVELSALGLDPPQYMVRFNDTLIAFGEIEPISQRRYILIADQVHLISDAYTFVLMQIPGQ